MKRNEVLAHAKRDLPDSFQQLLVTRGFRRAPNSLQAKRSVPDGVQLIDLHVASNPPYMREAIAHFMLFFELRFPSVDVITEAMRGNLESRASRRTLTLRCSAENMPPREQRRMIGARSPGEFPNALRLVEALVEKYVMPVLDQLMTVPDLISRFEQRDTQVEWQEHHGVTIAAAHIAIGDIPKARQVLRSEYPLPGQVRRYKSAFEYVARL